MRDNGSVTNIYATGRVSGAVNRSGLEGHISSAASLNGASAVTNSYWGISNRGQTSTADSGAVGKTTRNLQIVTSYTGIYANLDRVAGNDAPW